MRSSRASTAAGSALLAFLLTACGSAGASSTTSPVGNTVSSARPSPLTYDPNSKAVAAVDRALAAASRDHRPVLIDFGADWCPDCRVLEQLYADSAVAPLLSSDYHLVLVDVGHFNRNLSLATRYINLQTSGIPALVVVTAKHRIAYASNDGAFSNARTMNAQQVAAFLRQWASAK